MNKLTFFHRRISGPGMSSNYFYQVFANKGTKRVISSDPPDDNTRITTLPLKALSDKL